MSRAQVSLWALTVVVVPAIGGTAQPLAAPASTTADASVAAGLFLLVVGGALLYGVLRRLQRSSTPPRP